MTSIKGHENTKQSGLPGAKHVRKRFRIPGEKVCKICEDKALAHHFNVLSCESCKAFFRRNALKQSELTCLFEEKCIITKTTRKNCATCRLKKCFDMGMNPELIFDECQKKELMKKIKENKSKQARYQDDKTEDMVLSSSSCATLSSGRQYSACLSPTNSDSQSFSSSSSPYNTSSSGGTPAGDTCETLNSKAACASQQSLVMPLLENMAIDKLDEEMTRTFSAHDDLSHMTLMVEVIPSSNQSTFHSSPAEASSHAALPDNPGLSATPLADKIPQSQPVPRKLTLTPVPQRKPEGYQLISHSQLPSDPQMYWRLSEEERMLLTLLSSVYEETVLSSLKLCHKNKKNISVLTINDFLDEYEVQVRQTIHFVRRLEDFRRLASDEQVTIFKATCQAVTTVRNAYIYVEERQTWLSNIGEITVEMMRNTFSFHAYLDSMIELNQSLKSIIKNDTILYAVMSCIILFDPSCGKIKDRQLVSSIQDKYVILLRHYLESEFSYKYSDFYMQLLMKKLVEIRELIKAQTEFRSLVAGSPRLRFTQELLAELYSE